MPLAAKTAIDSGPSSDLVAQRTEGWLKPPGSPTMT
jgi:hypothetical protein